MLPASAPVSAVCAKHSVGNQPTNNKKIKKDFQAAFILASALQGLTGMKSIYVAVLYVKGIPREYLQYTDRITRFVLQWGKQALTPKDS
jgi:hypothetical protein